MSTSVGRSRGELYPTTGGSRVHHTLDSSADAVRSDLRREDCLMRIVPLIAALAVTVTGIGTGILGASWQVTPALADGAATALVRAASVPAASVRADSPEDARLDPPVAGVLRVVNRFYAPGSEWDAGHRGVDLEAEVGMEVLAPAGGTVSFSGGVVDRGIVTITHPSGLRSSLEPVEPLVRIGDRVTVGQTVGLASAVPGHCAPAVCLHWGVRRGATYLDPLSLLRGYGPIVLLPIMPLRTDGLS
jgi:murein DD-endopeptidase MepM/ murein hydrolase activator NlpD